MPSSWTVNQEEWTLELCGDAVALWGELSNIWKVTAVLLYLKCTNTIDQTLQFCIRLPWFLWLYFFLLLLLNKWDFWYPYQPWKLNISFSFLTKMCQLWISVVIACHTSKRYELQQSCAILGCEVNLSDSCFTALQIMFCFFFSFHHCNI